MTQCVNQISSYFFSMLVSKQSLFRSLKCIAFLMCFTIAWANNSPLNQTKTKLQQLDNQISQLKKNLANASDKRGLLNIELANTEKEISKSTLHLRLIEQNMSEKQQKIKTYQQRINDLNNQLIEQQKLLAKHIRVRHRMGEYQPIKWLLNQDDPYKVGRLLTFHQYIVQSRQTMITEIDTTKHNLTANQEALKNELVTQEQLQEKLHTHQQKLEQNKHYNTTVIQSINNEIQNKKTMLSEYEHNKANLSQLLKNLATQSVIQAKKPFMQMKHKLPKPISAKPLVLQKMNQGLTFFAGEGTPVNAIYHGKVVFSDWLNGYGLLLIIDHGQGFMTLYAHNLSLFKQKGTTVLQGEQIAAVGHSGGLKQNGLYFEVRHRGKAIPPLDWLS